MCCQVHDGTHAYQVCALLATHAQDAHGSEIDLQLHLKDGVDYGVLRGTLSLISVFLMHSKLRGRYHHDAQGQWAPLRRQRSGQMQHQKLQTATFFKSDVLKCADEEGRAVFSGCLNAS